MIQSNNVTMSRFSLQCPAIFRAECPVGLATASIRPLTSNTTHPEAVVEATSALVCTRTAHTKHADTNKLPLHLLSQTFAASLNRCAGGGRLTVVWR